jgi:predicted secreted protein
MSKGFTGVGTKLQRFVGGSWVSISNILSISGPSLSREMVDTTSFDAVDSFRDFVSGLKDGGTLSFDMLFTKTGALVIKGDFLDDSKVQYRILFPGQRGFIAFYGMVTGMPLTIPVTDAIKASITIKVIGKLTLPAKVTTKAIAGVTAPVKGATPVTTTTPNAQFTGVVAWSPPATTFAGATEYTATITLTDLSAYTFNGVAANHFTVAGSTSCTNPANSGVVTAIFPATEA